MKIIVEKKVIETEEIEVEFPLYIQHSDIYDNGGTYTAWYKITEEGDLYELTKRSFRGKDEEYEFKKLRIDLKTQLNYYLTSGNFDSLTSKEQFKTAVVEFQTKLGPFGVEEVPTPEEFKEKMLGRRPPARVKADFEEALGCTLYVMPHQINHWVAIPKDGDIARVEKAKLSCWPAILRLDVVANKDMVDWEKGIVKG